MSDRYIFRYIIILVVIVSILLSGAAMLLRPYQQRNIENEKHIFILKAAGIHDANNDNIEELFKQHCTDSKDGDFPMYIIDNQITVIPMRGNGLWGPIWGYIGIAADNKTVVGAVFDHKSETPGLGGEITTAKFQSQFRGKQFFIKGQMIPMDVDAISGATKTSNGVKDMIDNTMQKYREYFEKR